MSKSKSRAGRTAIIAALLALGLIAAVLIAPQSAAKTSPALLTDTPKEKDILSDLTHQQKVWLYALEWCESNGINEAINPNDLDGTPSYYAYQFKPSTFEELGKLYGVIATSTPKEKIPELLKQYELQQRIVVRMILDPKTRWERQFPWCVKKLGRPPVARK